LTPPLFLIYDYEHDFGYTSTWADETKALIASEKYNRFVADLVISLKDRKVLVFVDRIEHGEILERYIPGALFVNGGKEADWNQKIVEKFANGEIKALIATKVVGEGVDTIAADTCVLAGAGKAQSEVVQKIGRMLRPLEGKDYSVLIDFTHDRTKFLSRHHKQRIKIYKSYNTKVIHKEEK
jgi:superfamily II DNA or RNA helicase